MKTEPKPFCFGMPSAFCVSSETCRDCECVRDCMTAVYPMLARLTGIEPKLFKRMFNNHLRLMKSSGLKPDEDYETEKSLPKPDEVLDSFLADLAAKNILKKGFIADDLSEAPDYFREIVEIIKVRGSTTQTRLLTHIKAVLPDLKDPISHTALTLQALAKMGIIEAKKSKKTIHWVGNEL